MMTGRKFIVNHHFFFNNDYGDVFKGPDLDSFRVQVKQLKKRYKAGSNLNVITEENEFYITIDDGSRSVLNIIDMLMDEGVKPYICICGEPTLGKGMLNAHKISLLRKEIGDAALWGRLKELYGEDLIDRPLKIPALNNVDIYRYDNAKTKQLKLALNYQLKHKELEVFLSEVFEGICGKEKGYTEELYLNLADVNELEGYCHLSFHGNKHLLWTELDSKELAAEINPPLELEKLLKDSYFLSAPFGMNGSFDSKRLRENNRFSGGVLTMLRKFEHSTEQDFKLFHRYDQNDVFEKDNALKSVFM